MATDNNTCETSIGDIVDLPDDKNKKLVQLKLENVTKYVKNSVVSLKPAAKKMRQSSSDSDSSPDSELAVEFDTVNSRLDEIIKNMVTKSDLEVIIKNTVKETLAQFKGELITHQLKSEMNCLRS